MSKGSKIAKHKIFWTIFDGVGIAVFTFGAIELNAFMPSINRIANSVVNGYTTSVNNSLAKTEGLDLDFYQEDYTSDSLKVQQKKLYNQVAEEGGVLLKNEDSYLPLADSTTFSIFGVNSAKVTYGGEMMGILNTSHLSDAFKQAGVKYNEDLYNYYSSSKYGLGSGSVSFGLSEDFSIKECPLKELEDKGLLASSLNTSPIFFLKRVAGEGRYTPRSMYNHSSDPDDQKKTYIEPNKDELEVISYINDNFPSATLVVNSNAALDLSFLNDYPHFKSVLYMPDGLSALPGILTGAINPSGKTVDTFAANPLNSPAAMNFGDYQYTDSSNNLTKYNYVSYQEGIYVGYRYYETRYEDYVMGKGNPGAFNYKDEVIFPFGYGLSYTDFTYSNYSYSEDGDKYTVSLDVTNTGSKSGKEVIELYLSSPYTQYDIDNKIEKGSVSLVGFAKTGLLSPNQRESVSIDISREDLKSYDSNKAKTYIIDQGDYLLTVASSAHQACNNILTYKGYSGNKMTGIGDASSVFTHHENALDTTTYSEDSSSGNKVTNHFDDAKVSLVLSRNDWLGTFPTHDGEVSSTISTWENEINGADNKSYVYTKQASDSLIKKLDSFDSDSPVDKNSFTEEPVYGQKNNLTISDMRGLDYSDPKWDSLLNELTSDEYYQLVGVSGYGVERINSINKPFTVDVDAATGLAYSAPSRVYPNPMTLAQSYNSDLALEYGQTIGNEALLGHVSGWYAPAMNIHRTPFSGRNGEYYSEDPYLSGSIASQEVYGAATKGVYSCVKHFAFNDQENHRGDTDGQYSIATWLDEQGAREIYLKPFEMCLKTDGVTLKYIKNNGDGTYSNATKTIKAGQAVMTSFNRVGSTWAGGDYDLLTGVLRNEWGFKGAVITDNANTGVFMDGYQMIEAGGDIKLTQVQKDARFNFDSTDKATYHYVKEAAHHYLFTVANSKVTNHCMHLSVLKEGLRTMDLVVGSLTGLFIVLDLVNVFYIVRRFTYRRGPKKEAE